MNEPSISIVIPTLNSQMTIGRCLESIKNQDFPGDKIEILIADGGSTDRTLQIVKSIPLEPMRLTILPNTLKTGEAGKAVGAKAARAGIVAFIDSDNILPFAGWFKKMVTPFSDPDIIASEPLEYTHRPDDGYITRYCALMGMNDPLCLFLGNYDRYNAISGTWTRMPHTEEDHKDYIKVGLHKDRLPTIGANGFLIRRDILKRYEIGDYLFDIDIIHEVLKESDSDKVAKVKVGIVHIFGGGLSDFIRKQRRRVRDYAYYKQLGLRKYQWNSMGKAGIIKFCIYSILLIPLIVQVVVGYTHKRDRAWLFHIPACLVTFFVYSIATLRGTFGVQPLSRDTWQVST